MKERKKGRRQQEQKRQRVGWWKKVRRKTARKTERQQDRNLQGLGDERKKGERKRPQKDDSKKEYGRGPETGLTRQPRRSTWPAAGWSRRRVKPGRFAPPSHLLLAQVSSPVLTSRQQGSRKPQSVCIQAIGPHVHPLDFHSVHEIYSFKSVLRYEKIPPRNLLIRWWWRFLTETNNPVQTRSAKRCRTNSEVTCGVILNQTTVFTCVQSLQFLIWCSHAC